MSETSTITVAEANMSESYELSNSTRSITLSKRKGSPFSSLYKQASNYFLTRRFHEAYTCIIPVFQIQTQEIHDTSHTAESESPIAAADRKWRVKLWSFYLTLLNAIAELGPEQGSAAFGESTWNVITSKLQDGSIWEDVVSTGYGGSEAQVDAEVVMNLANLLLSQSSNQNKNQAHLENYFSIASPADMHQTTATDRQSGLDTSAIVTATQFSNGTTDIKSLETHVKIIEIYTLHVLPRNGEWDYAKDFLNMSDVLDEERREILLQTLQDLRNEEYEDSNSYESTGSEREVKAHKIFTASASDMARTDSDITIKPSTRSELRNDIHRKSEATTAELIKPLRSISPMPIPASPASLPTRRHTNKPLSRSGWPNTSKPSLDQSRPLPNSATLLRRGMTIITTIQRITQHLSSHMMQDPSSLLKFVLFLMGLIVAFSRKNIRQRVRGLTGSFWDKLLLTIGMGAKVSYI